MLTGPIPSCSPVSGRSTPTRAVCNHDTGWVTAVSVAQLLLDRGLTAEAPVRARRAAADSVAMGMRANHIVVEVLGGVLVRNGDVTAAAKVFAVAEGQTVRLGLRWPRRRCPDPGRSLA